MLSGKLIHLIESHWDTITTHALGQIRKDPGLTHIGGLPEAELRDWAQAILRNLGRWMTQDNREELAQHYEAQGKLRFEEEVPLAEAVKGLCVLKHRIFDYVHEQGNARTPADIYAEEEFELLVGRFFDSLICNLVRGYEAALRHAARPDAGSEKARHAHR